jgi:phospholipid transport system substrate-binding protein
MRIHETLLAVAGIGLVALLPASGRAQSPTAVLKKANTEVDKLLAKKAAKGSPAERRLKDDIKAIVIALLDYDELSQRTLSRHWGGMTPAQRADFIKVFRELLERTYARRIRTGVDYGITFKDEKVDGAKATVRTVVRAKRKGRMTDTMADYCMLRKEGKWRVWDVVTEEDEYSSLMRNYRSEFNRIWAKDGLEGVMKKMRKKIAEGTEPR